MTLFYFAPRAHQRQHIAPPVVTIGATSATSADLVTANRADGGFSGGTRYQHMCKVAVLAIQNGSAVVWLVYSWLVVCEAPRQDW